MPASRHDLLESVLESAIEETDGEDISVQDLLHLFGDRSFGPIVALLGLLTVVPPLGAIPGLPAIVGLAIILFAIQIPFSKHVWMPKPVRNMSIGRDKLETANEKWKPWLAKIDKLITERLTFFASPPAVLLAAVIICILALMMVPLELVPFAVAAPGLAITLFGVGIMARDGALMLVAFLASIVTLIMTVMVVPWDKVAGVFGG